MEELFEFDISDVDVAAFESVVTPAAEPLNNEVQVPSQLSIIETQPQSGQEEQISSQIEEQSTNHSQHHDHYQLHKHVEIIQENPIDQNQDTQSRSEPLHDKLQPPAPPPSLAQQANQTVQIQLQQKHQLTATQQIQLQQHLQNHQITSATGQQPCKILLIPINSTKSGTPGLKSDCFIPGFKNLIQIPQGTSPLSVKTIGSNTLNNFNNHHHIESATHATSVKKYQAQSLQTTHPTPPASQLQSQPMTSSPNMIANEVPKRKPCNCTKSQCLKLYCDCFANGEFCSGCNCKDCYNSLSREKERQKAISQCLERNPEAFRPKIGKAIKGTSLGEPTQESIERRHTKGCNCKRSGCLKNYCECYEAKILCSNLCKCCGCKNYEESFERKTLMQLANSSDAGRGILKSLLPTNSVSNSNSSGNVVQAGISTSRHGQPTPTKNFISKEVIHASLVCLLQSAQQAEKDGVPPEEIPNLIQTEMGRCLRMIVNSIK